MTDDLHPDADELQEELRELLREKTEFDPSSFIFTSVPNRPRGILSTVDREYLAGLKEYEHPQSESNRKQEIRDRVINAIQDFPILVQMLGAEERKKIFNDEISEWELQASLESIISFLYLGLDEDSEEVEKIIENGIYTGANLSKMGRWSGEVVDVDANIDIDRRPDRSEIFQKFQQGKTGELTPAEIGILVRSGQIDGDDLDELEDTSIPYPFAFQGLERMNEE